MKSPASSGRQIRTALGCQLRDLRPSLARLAGARLIGCEAGPHAAKLWSVTTSGSQPATPMFEPDDPDDLTDDLTEKGDPDGDPDVTVDMTRDMTGGPSGSNIEYQGDPDDDPDGEPMALKAELRRLLQRKDIKVPRDGPMEQHYIDVLEQRDVDVVRILLRMAELKGEWEPPQEWNRPVVPWGKPN